MTVDPTNIDADLADIEAMAALLEEKTAEVEAPETEVEVEEKTAEVEAPETEVEVEEKTAEVEAPEIEVEVEEKTAEVEAPEIEVEVEEKTAEVEEKALPMMVEEEAVVEEAAPEAEPETVTCPECGYENEAGSVICAKCGAKLEAEMPEEAPMDDTELKADHCACEKPQMGDDMLCKGCGLPMGLEKKDDVAIVETLNEKQAEVLALRDAHMKSFTGEMALKAANGEEITDGFLCSAERKVLAVGANPCEGCAGGCHAEKGHPDLLMIEAIAKKTLGGEVLDSGYSELTDLYLVDIQRKDDDGADETIQAIYNGMGKLKGWLALDEMSSLDEKSLGSDHIDVEGAVKSAISQIEGEAVSIVADILDDVDVYSVEINGIDGKSYDVFVALDGTVIGWDEYAVKSEDSDIENSDGTGPVEEKGLVTGEEAEILASLMEFEVLSAEIDSL